MQENNFEKQMQQAMQEFSITPSDNLWQQVKADLDAKRKSKRRWWFAAMIFFACLMLPSLLLNDLKRTKDNTANNIAIENSNPAKTVIPEVVNTGRQTKQAEENKNDQTEVEQKVVTIAKEKISSTKKEIKTTDAEILNDQERNKNSFVKEVSRQKNAVVESAKRFDTKRKKAIAVSNADITTIDEQNESAGIVLQREPVKIIPEATNLISLSRGLKTSQLQIQPVRLAMLEPVYKATAGIRANKSKSINKGRFEIAVAAGRFSLSENSLLSAVFNADPNKAYDVQSANVSGGVGIIDSVLYAKSYLQHGYSFSLAFNYNKPVSKKTSLSAGAGFRYGSTKLFSESYLTYAGPSNNLYSRAAGTVSVSNHFYFVDLPVQIESLIGSGRKLPIYWNAGLQYSFLIQSSTPQFNAIQNSYSSSVLSKSLLGITAGIDVELFKNKKSAFKIGPSLYYSFSKAAEKDFYQNMHYHFAGIRLKKSL